MGNLSRRLAALERRMIGDRDDVEIVKVIVHHDGQQLEMAPSAWPEYRAAHPGREWLSIMEPIGDRQHADTN